MKNSLGEKCGIFGVYGKGLDAARLTYFGLYALQHRGQESSGIASSNGKRIKVHKNLGLVAQVYSEKDLKKLGGFMAIGHNRYSTSGGTFIEHTQPAGNSDDIVVLAHNGNLPATTKLKRFLKSKRISIKGLNDSGLMHKAIKYYLSKKYSLEEAIKASYPLFTGAFCMLIMTKNKIAAVRDRFGIRPFCLGKLNGGYIFASETCALDTVNAIYLQDIQPGEMVIVDSRGLHSYQIVQPNQKLDIFELVYFSRPDSMLLGKRVYKVRENLGKELAKEHPIQADVVIPVPDSSIPAALGYASALGIPCEYGLVKNRYIGRTFIMPDQKLRDSGVQMKLNPIPEIIKDKRVVLIDDSIVRGTTAQKLVTMMRDVGAKEVHLLSSCPPVLFPDFYGIDTPTQKQLIAANMTLSQMKKFMNVDSLGFLSYEGLIRATELPEHLFCTSCFTGDYPIDIGPNKKTITTPVTKLHVSKKKKKIAILISNKGTGSNLQAIIDAKKNGKLKLDIALVVSDKEDAKGLTRAEKHNIPFVVLRRPINGERNTYGEKLANILNEKGVDIAVLAGFMTILPPSYFEEFKGVTINIHPGLIPDRKDSQYLFPDGTPAPWNQGKMTESAVRNFLSLKFAGSTIHVVTQEADFGPVLDRRIIPVEKDDTVETLYQRLKEEEHSGLISVLSEFSNVRT